jgi:hypothetical protein
MENPEKADKKTRTNVRAHPATALRRAQNEKTHAIDCVFIFPLGLLCIELQNEYRPNINKKNV